MPSQSEARRHRGRAHLSGCREPAPVPDLAVIGTPPETVPGIIADLAGRGTKAAVVLTAGFGEGGGARRRAAPGDARCRQASAHAHRWSQLPRDPGPWHRPQRQLCARRSVARAPCLGRPIGRDGGRCGRLGNLARHRLLAPGLLGDMADVDFGDMLDYLASDPETRAILLYVETITNARNSCRRAGPPRA